MILIDLILAFILFKIIQSKIKDEQEWKAYQKYLKTHGFEFEDGWYNHEYFCIEDGKLKRIK